MIKTGIVCGCLPVQSGIEHSALYHQLLASAIFSQTGKQLVISSVWYTTLSGCKKEILSLIAKEDPEIILYHVRPDPYLKVSKLFIRYRDDSDKFHLLLNINADDSGMFEKSYPSRGSLPVRKRSSFKIISRDFNYLTGLIFRVNRRAIDREKRLLHEISEMCKKHHRQLILVGPASRPGSNMENYLLKRLEIKLAGEFRNAGYRYITCYGTFGRDHENLFMEDGVHVSKAGHKRMAELIAPALMEMLREKFNDMVVEM